MTDQKYYPEYPPPNPYPEAPNTYPPNPYPPNLYPPNPYPEAPNTYPPNPYPPNPGYDQGGPPPTYYPPSGQQQQSTVIVNQAQPTAQSPVIVTVAEEPSDYFGLALFTLLCCFWPLGIVALIKSIETRNQIQSGNLSQAQESSLQAKKFSMIGIVIGIAWDVLVVILVIILSAARASAST